jgi:hypothetical protein
MLQLHPENPHYFLWQGRPTLLIGSGEHYGAVLNSAFDYRSYLRALQADGLNHSRLFTGVYVEAEVWKCGDGMLTDNTLGPGPGQLICPYARSETPGYAHGGTKFDLSRWDEGYFARLHDFVAQADAHGVVVEVNLFCSFYDGQFWGLSPWHAANNVNDVGQCLPTDVCTLDRSGPLLGLQEALVRRIVAELRDSGNVYYEICNEPYFGGVTLAWQRHIAALIAAEEAGRSEKHLISQNVANLQARVTDPRPEVSILNFHYAWPPATVAMNWALGRPIGDNETGFQGTEDAPYRREAWEFVLAGGALFSHLDYTFTVGHEDGSYALRPDQAGGGGRALRAQLGRLKTFIEGFDVLRMRADDTIVRVLELTGPLSGGLTQLSARVLAEPGKQYALYVAGGTRARLEVVLPPGRYRAEWLHPGTGQREAGGSWEHGGGAQAMLTPTYEHDIALSIRRVAG